MFLLKPSAGAILHNGVDPLALPRRQFQSHRRDYQIIFQDPNAALNPRMTILSSVLEPLELARAGNKAERSRRAREAMDRVGLPQDVGDRYPHQLSGGQKQRVVIARALTLRPKLIVCDEVVAALDMSIRGDVLNLFAELQRDLGLTYVFITHDLAVVSHISERIAVMYLGRFVELGPTERFPNGRCIPTHRRCCRPSHGRCRHRCAVIGVSCCRVKSRARSIRLRDAVSAPAASMRRRSAPSKTPDWRELSPITGSPAISPTVRTFHRTDIGGYAMTTRKTTPGREVMALISGAAGRAPFGGNACAQGRRNAAASCASRPLLIRRASIRDRRRRLGSRLPVHDVRHADGMGV